MGEPPCGKPCETASLVSKRLHILAEIGYHRIVNPSELLEFSADRTSPVHLERISYERNTPAQHHRPHRLGGREDHSPRHRPRCRRRRDHVLMGPNGAGKSTMGHVIMGDPVYTVNEGTITFDGQDITDLSPRQALPRRSVPLLPGTRRDPPACHSQASCARASPAPRPRDEGQGVPRRVNGARRRARHGHRLPQPRAGRGLLRR